MFFIYTVRYFFVNFTKKLLKKLTVIIILILTFSIIKSVKAQFENENFLIGVQGTNVWLTNHTPKTAYGISMQLFVSDNFSFNSNIIFGENYIHVPIGIAAISLAAFSGNADCCTNIGYSDDFFEYLFMLLFSEGFSFHLEIADNFVISPYFNPLGFDYWFEKNNLSECLIFTGSAGVKFNFFATEKFIISPFAGYKTSYVYWDRGFSFGLNLSVLFDF